MAAIGQFVHGRAETFQATFSPLTLAAKSAEWVPLGGVIDIGAAYFVWPANLTAGAARLVTAHDPAYAGVWEPFGAVPDVVAGGVTTVQISCGGILNLSVEVTAEIAVSSGSPVLTVVFVGKVR